MPTFAGLERIYTTCVHTQAQDRLSLILSMLWKKTLKNYLIILEAMFSYCNYKDDCAENQARWVIIRLPMLRWRLKIQPSYIIALTKNSRTLRPMEIFGWKGLRKLNSCILIHPAGQEKQPPPHANMASSNDVAYNKCLRQNAILFHAGCHSTLASRFKRNRSQNRSSEEVETLIGKRN